MKILFCYTDINMRGGAKSFHYGIAILSALLKKYGHRTRLHYMYPKYDIQPLEETVHAFQPDMLAFSSTSAQFRYVKKILEDLPLDKRVFTLCGGPHVTLEPESFEAVPRLDAICRGEGEEAMIDLVRRLEKNEDIRGISNLWVRDPQDGRIHRNASNRFIQDLDSLPFADRELFPYQSIIDSDFHTALFMFSRGCPFNCSYCSNQALRGVQSGKYVRFRSVDNCLQEVEEVLSNYRADAIYVNDDLFTLNKDFVAEFCEKYKQRIGLPFDINTRVGYVDETLCAQLKSANCRRVNIGIESGSPRIRQKILNRKMSNEQIIETFQMLKAAGLKTKSFNMIGFPEETPEDFMETIRLNRIIQPDSVILNVFDPYPGTPLGERCKTEGLIDWARMESDLIPKTDTVLNLPQFPRKTIKHFYKRFAYEVYKETAPHRALFYRIYYSDLGEHLLRILAPVKTLLRKWTMGI